MKSNGSCNVARLQFDFYRNENHKITYLKIILNNNLKSINYVTVFKKNIFEPICFVLFGWNKD